MFRLLIAEDEFIERMVLKKMLENYFGPRCQICEAENGEQALELFAKMPFQVALLDISMPGMGGIEAAQHLHRMDSSCVLLFLTAHDRFEYARKAIEVRAQAYLLKPYSRTEVIEAVERAAVEVEARCQREPAAKEQLDEYKACNTGYADQVSRFSVMASMLEDYIRCNYMNDISMADAARAMHYSEPYFCKMFKLHYGQSFTAYLTDYRIERAKKMLLSPCVNVKEVGQQVGYPDSGYFTKVFRRITGQSPSEYRASVLQHLQ